MSEQDKGSVDLPEPKRVQLSEAELATRRWHLFQSLNIFLFAYACLHKVIIPVVRASMLDEVEFTFSTIDWWWPYHLLLYIAFAKHSKRWICGLANFGLSFTLFKLIFGLYHASQGGVNLSWNIVSLLMTEGFTFGYLIALFFQPTMVRGSILFVPRILAILFGIILSTLFYSSSPMNPSFTLMNPADQKEATPVEVQTDKRTQGNCGLERIELTETKLKDVPRRSEISVDLCGFRPGLIYASDRLRIQNNTPAFLNIKIEYLERDGASTKWHLLKNLPLLAKEHLDLESEWIQHQVIRIKSDSSPRSGIAVVLGSNQNDDIALPVAIER